MNFAFLILVAIPLGAFLIVMLVSMRDIDRDETHTDASHPSAELVDTSVWLDDQVEPLALQESIPSGPIFTDAEINAEIPSSSDVTLILAAIVAPITESISAETEPIHAELETIPAPVTASNTTETEPIHADLEPVSLADILSETTASLAAPVTESNTVETESTHAELETIPAPVTASNTTETEPIHAELEPVSLADILAETTASIASQPTESITESVPAPVLLLESSATTSEPEPPTALPIAESASEPIVAETAQPAPAPALTPILETESLEPDQDDPILPEGPVQLSEKGSPKYAFDYRGRLWIEKKNKGFFRQLRRPQLPPDDPSNGR